MGRRLKIGIIGAGFSGTALAATLSRLNSQQTPLDIFLCDKTGCFGQGEAYRTREPYHLLNVRAKDMSAFCDDKNHFVDWLKKYSHPIDGVEEEFVSRSLYGDYLQFILQEIKKNPLIKLTFISSEVIDIIEDKNKDKDKNIVQLIFKDYPPIIVNKVVLAIGNNSPSSLPFQLSSYINYIANPWHPDLFKKISSQDNVLIIGTGLSMADAVLSLHHQCHKGKIYATSRRGLLPLAHSDSHDTYNMNKFPCHLHDLTKLLRKTGKNLIESGKPWQNIVNAVRKHIPEIWNKLTVFEKKQFLRHVLPYWNIHRHRLPKKTLDFLKALSEKKQFFLLPGKVIDIKNNHIQLQLRATQEIQKLQINTIINCTGPGLNILDIKNKKNNNNLLIHSLLKKNIALLDELQLGFKTTHEGALINEKNHSSTIFFALGSPTKGLFWESNAVPEIRQYCYVLAKKILDQFLSEER